MMEKLINKPEKLFQNYDLAGMGHQKSAYNCRRRTVAQYYMTVSWRDFFAILAELPKTPKIVSFCIINVLKWQKNTLYNNMYFV